MKFSIITLGCKVNAYESQYYAGQLEKLGYEQEFLSILWLKAHQKRNW